MFFSVRWSQGRLTFQLPLLCQRSKKNEPALSAVEGAQFLEKTRTLRNLRQTCPRQRRTPIKNK